MKQQKLVGAWLMLGVAMLMIQVLLGGITRLTGSGLSITEWKPLLGALPPASETEWLRLFEKYKQIAQFKVLNTDFSLENFKFIFFWEWFHRNWARFIGIVFLLPFVWFLWKRMIRKEWVPGLIALFTLGLAQGLIGWIMVASGLNDENLYVSHIRLAIHFLSAMVLIAFTYSFGLFLWVSPEQRVINSPLRKLTMGILILLGIQLLYGAFMAGLKAGSAAPTWPDQNGVFLPTSFDIASCFHAPLTIHFIHRNLAYGVSMLVIFWYLQARKVHMSTALYRYRMIPLLLVIVQVCLGIFTVLRSQHPSRNAMGGFETLALLHQATAMCLVMSFVWALFMLRPAKSL